MYLVLSASKDSYITDKIINNSFSASNANTGRASTLDLFRLYNESYLSGVSPTNELSRLLIKFDYGRIRKFTHSTLNLNSTNFQAKLKLFDIMGGQATPSNFKLILFPLSQSFDEGIGRNVASYSDLDACNFATASYSNSTNNAWHLSGANAQGTIDTTSDTGYPANIDIIISGNLNDGDGTKGLGITQTFVEGGENLTMDVTTIVSATLAGILPDYGFRISFTGSQEEDNKTRFVKRFASRHVRNSSIQPRLDVSWDDTIVDNHKDFYFDLSGSLFLKNFTRGQPANIVSGSSLLPVTGNNCIKLTLRTGSFVFEASASQHQAGTKIMQTVPGAGTPSAYNYVTGVYSASFAIPSSDSTTVAWGTTLAQMIARTGSVTFDEYWSDTSGLVGYHTGSIKIERISRTSFNVSPASLDFIVINAQNSYKKSKKVLLRVFIRDFNAHQKAKRVPYSLPSVILEEVYYRVRDADSNDIIIPFETAKNGTRLSSDSEGMYFEFMTDLPVGRTYTFDFLSKDGGFDLITQAKNVRFRIDE